MMRLTMELKISKDKRDAILARQRDLNARLYGLTIAVAHLFAIEARENPEGAADRALGDVDGTVEGVARQLPEKMDDMRAGITEQLRLCLRLGASQIERAKRQAPTSSSRN